MSCTCSLHGLGTAERCQHTPLRKDGSVGMWRCACPCHAHPVGRITKVEVVRNAGAFTIAADPNCPPNEIRLVGDLAKLPKPGTCLAAWDELVDAKHQVGRDAYSEWVARQLKGFLEQVQAGHAQLRSEPPTPEREPDDAFEFRLKEAYQLHCAEPGHHMRASIDGVPVVPATGTADIADLDAYDAGHLRDQLGERDAQIRELEREVGRLALESRRLTKGGRR